MSELPKWIRNIEFALARVKSYRDTLKLISQTSLYYYDNKQDCMVSNLDKLKQAEDAVIKLEKKYKDALARYKEWKMNKDFE